MGYMSEFIDSYMETALWSSTDDSDDSGGDPLDDNYSIDDIAEKTRAAMRADCIAFVWANRADLRASGLTPGRAGHNFWLNRCGHGAGFWDEGLGDVGERLSKACRPYGDVYLYTHDGQVHS